jgi:V/A-type H+-transporting ATPase subunit F
MPGTGTAKPVAVIGERELVIGFRLIGIRDAFEVDEKNAAREFQRIFEGKEFSLILASRRIQNALPEALRHAAETSISPLVVFLPVPGAEDEPESVAALAKRVLGVSLETVVAP